MILISPHLSQGQQTVYGDLLKDQGAEFYRFPVGLCEDYPEETTTMDIIRKDMELLKNAGIDVLRISFGWDAIESEKDTYDWLFWDDFVSMAVDEYGITLIPYVCYTPLWNSTSSNLEDFWNHTPKDYEEFGEFMYDLVSRYKGRIKSWELWNEPDISAFWSSTADDYARLAKIGSEAVRRADPEAIVVLGGLAYDTDFTRELFRDHGISSYVDVVNIHNYFETWHPAPVEDIVHYVNEIAGIVEKYGDGQSIWMGEVGYSTWRMDRNKISDHYTALYDYEHTPEYQAVDIFKRLTLLASTEKLSLAVWYEIKDLPPLEEVIGDNNNRNLGVAYTDHTPKPGLDALRFFKRLFSDGYRCIDPAVEVRRSIQSESVFHAFETEDGSLIVVGWLKTNNPLVRDRHPDGFTRDMRQETVDISISTKLKGKVTLFDESGNGSEYKKYRRNGHSITLTDFDLSGGKVYIVTISKE